MNLGKIRRALNKVGFEDMIEVILEADILTLKEAYEYYSHMKKHEDVYFISFKIYRYKNDRSYKWKIRNINFQ